ncbi:hypothetical protein Gotur_026894, partial [Gossypium turneri]
MWDFTHISVTQNSLQELKEIWDQWNDEVKGGDLVPTVEEYMALLRCSKIQTDKVYSRAVNVPTFLKKLVNIFGMNEILYRCDNFDWVPLLRIWGAVGYAPLLVLRQYRSRQFVPATQGLAQCEFSYKDDGYKRKIREMSNACRQTRRMKRLAGEPKVRVAELEKTLYQYQNCNSVMELRASLDKIEQLKRRVEELEMALQSHEMRIEALEANKERQKEQLLCCQNQVRNRDHIMGEAVTQIREVADYLQTLAVQADIL